MFLVVFAIPQQRIKIMYSSDQQQPALQSPKKTCEVNQRSHRLLFITVRSIQEITKFKALGAESPVNTGRLRILKHI